MTYEETAVVERLNEELKAADLQRRDLLATVFLRYYEDSTDTIVRRLFASAPAEVLVEIERVLADA